MYRSLRAPVALWGLLGAAALLPSPRAEAQAPATTAAPAASEATYRIHHTLTIKDLPAGTKKVRVWFWLPQDDEAQKVLDFTVAQAPTGFRTEVDPTTGATYLYAEVDKPAAATIPIATDFTLCRRVSSVTLDPSKAGR